MSGQWQEENLNSTANFDPNCSYVIYLPNGTGFTHSNTYVNESQIYFDYCS